MATVDELVNKIDVSLTKAKADMALDVDHKMEGVRKRLDEELLPAIRLLQQERMKIEHAPNDFRKVEERGYVRKVDAKIRSDWSEDTVEKTVNLTGYLDKTDSRDGVWKSGLIDDPSPAGDWQVQLQEIQNNRAFLKGYVAGGRTPRADAELLAHLKAGPPQIAKVFSDVSVLGAEWIPDVTSANWVMVARGLAVVAPLFPRIAMTDKTMLLPFLGNGIRPFIKGQATDDNPQAYRASSASTTNRTLTAVSLALRSVIDEDAEEDAVAPMLPIIQNEHAQALADGVDDAIINGDPTSTHMDAIATWDPRSRWGTVGAGGSDDHRHWCKGLRFRALDNSHADNENTDATISFAMFLALRKMMASPLGNQATGIAYIMGIEGLLKSLQLAEVVTVDKFGNDAAVKTGDLRYIGGAPIFVSDFVTADLASTGLYTGSGSTSVILCVNRSRYLLGERKGRTVQVQQDVIRGIKNVVTTYRGTFATIDADTTKNVAIARNVTV